ncbi:MAG: sugar O-acetyltransferase [Nocardioides sp.]|nr:sugar O-acetyltransferase [Nocardioides sp.]
MSPTDDARSMRERMLAGDLYLADDPELIAGIQRAQRFMATYNTPTTDRETRGKALDGALGAIGEDSEIRPPFHVDYGENIRIGARFFANFGLVALDCCPITVGDDVQLGPNVQLLTPLHPMEARARRDKWEYAAPITVGDNVWIGGGAMILPGVSIGDNVVIGSGSVVTKDVPADTLAVGNPARVIRELHG